MPKDTFSIITAVNDTTLLRAWGARHATACDAIDFPRSGDSGQINWGTVTAPVATATLIGYEIRYLNDSLHGSKPCYVKIEWFSGTALTRSVTWLTIGTGTDGAGNISGVMLARTLITGATSSVNLSALACPYFYCGKEGYRLAILGRGAMNNCPTSAFAICRTADDSGTPTATGFHFYYTSPDSNYPMNRANYITTSVIDGAIVGLGSAATSALVGGDALVFKQYGFQPEYRCIPFVLVYYNADIGDQSEFIQTPVGVTPRTYLTIGGINNMRPNSGNDTLRFAFQYED